MLLTAAIAAAAFASTNLDDLFLLLGFFADARFRTRHIVLGQYLGIAALFCVSALASLLSLVLEPAYLGLTGLAPLAIGLWMLIALLRGGDDDEEERALPATSGILTIAAITIANGGDNLAVYIPLLAAQDATGVLVIALVFAILTGAWCLVPRWLLQVPALGALLRRHGAWITPLVLIGVGVWVLVEAGSFGLLRP